MMNNSTSTATATKKAPNNLSKPPPKRRLSCYFSSFSFLALQIVLLLFMTMATTTVSSSTTSDSQLFAMPKHYACHCDDDASTTVWPSCECIRVLGGGAFRSKQRTMGIRRFHSPWRMMVPRGGGGGINEQPHQPTENSVPSSSSPSQPHQQQQRMVPLSSLPLIDTKTASLALRLTCETNRRLHHGTSGGALQSGRKTVAATTAESVSSLQQPRHHNNAIMQQQQQQQMMVRPASSSSIPPAGKEELTVFHSKNPWEPSPTEHDGNTTTTTDASQTENGTGEKSSQQTTSQRATSKGGPNLHSYLDALLSSITPDTATHAAPSPSSPMEDESQLLLALALLYLDRSTSFDTTPPMDVDPLSGQPWFPPCPYLMPRTVHRLVLTAVVIAGKCVRGYDGRVVTALLEAANSMLTGSDGDDDERKGNAISEMELEQMENWMLHALGGGGSHHRPQHDSSHHWQISQEEITTFLRKWSATFYPSRLAAHDQSRIKQWERFWGGGDHDGPIPTTTTTAHHQQQQQQQHGHGNTYWPMEEDGNRHDGRRDQEQWQQQRHVEQEVHSRDRMDGPPGY
mmetsp:Transcript_26315/g.43067  ORF Transcript_26315/g.43067 Transcript_26315/m.43067 type:complete len:571 (+) Transcript_26315:86-1798(+)